MKREPWSIRNAALWGFALGALFYPLRALLVGEAQIAGATAAVAASAGAGLGGMVLLALAAFLHNVSRSGSR